jgi:carboxyl-terminal processing protease
MRYLRQLLTSLFLASAVAATALPVASAPVAPAAGISKSDLHTQARKAQLIGELLSEFHYRTLTINGAMAAQALQAYLDTIDQERYYLLKQDIDEFQRTTDLLDDELKQGNLSAGYRIFERYQQRVGERADFAARLLEKPLDLTSDERIEIDRSEAPWAADQAELDALWRKRVKHDALTLLMAGQEWPKVQEILSKRYARLASTVANYSHEEIFQTYINAWAQLFDPHTQYMSPRLSENFDIQMRLSLEGIGAMLRSENDFVEVVELVKGGPAALDGQLQPGDRIIGVGEGMDGDISDVVGWRLSDVVERIRGPKKTTVRLQVLPGKAGGDAAKTISIVRNEIKLEEQAAQAKTLTIPAGGDTSKRIGVIKLPAFYMDFAAADAGKKDYRSTTRDVRALLAQFKQDGIDGLVVDLRGNGGGSLREATELTGLFIHGGPVVQVRRHDGAVEVIQEPSRSIAYSGPLVVLVDQFSASASEIFAAAIQDYGRGIVAGQKTFGKGTVQTLIDLDRGIRSKDNGGRLKLTIAKFYRINGHSTQLRGVEPDIALPSAFDADRFAESASKTSLPWDEIRAIPFLPRSNLEPLIPVLRKRHDAWAANNPAFQALVDEYAQLREMQARNSLPLNEKQRRLERDEDEARQLASVNRRLAAYDLKPLPSLDKIDQDAVPDTILESAAAIVVDLADLRSGTTTVSR